MPRIIVQFGGEEWSVDLREGVNVAGRSPQAAIPIRDASMSREHCEIVLEGGVATVVDRGSMNGTLVNGAKMDRKVLVPGDKIQIGKASLYFEEKKGATAPAAASKKAETPIVGLDDFSVWRRESGGLLKALIGLVALGVLGAGAFFLFKSMGPGAAVAADPGNLLGVSGRFEPGPDRSVVGWAMKAGQASRIQPIDGAAKEGKTYLQLEKSGASTDLVAEVIHQEIFATTPGPVEVSTWVRTESASVLPALKVSWLAARKGPLLLEESSEPTPRTSDWTQITHSFTPPPGATNCQVSLIAAGRAGRVFFDDVRVRAGTGVGTVKSADLGPYAVVASPAGALMIGQDTRRVLNNVQIFLASDKEGTIFQSAAMGGRVEADPATKKLAASGKLSSPVDLRPVEYEIEASKGKEGLLLGYRLRGDALKQVDRLGLSLLLPGADLKGDYTNPTSRLWFRGGASGDYILEISDGLMRVTADWVPEARRVALSIPIPKGVSEVAFGFLLKSGAGGPTDPMAAVELAKKEGRMSDALAILRDLLAATREEKKRGEVQARLKEIEEIEGEDWKAVQAQSFRAELVGLKPFFEDAIVKLDQYEKRWPGGKRTEAANAVRAKLTRGLGEAAEDRETVRAHRLMDRAEEHRKEGRKMLARELCEAVRRHYGSTSAAPRAAALLKSLGSE